MDVSKYCRTCLNNNNSAEMLSIYAFIDGILPTDADFNNVSFAPTTKHAISEMLEAITGNKITSSSELPTKICVKCTDNVKMSFAFQHQCKRSFEILTSMLKDKLLTDQSIEIDISGLHNINTPDLLEDNIQKNQQLNSDFSDRPAEATERNHKEIQTDERLYYECEMCDCTFFDEFSLKHHRTVHPDIKCMRCNKMFTRLNSLRNHLYVSHKKSNKSGVERECKECKKIFGTNQSFIHHIKVFEMCGKNLENIKKAKRITDANIRHQNKIRANEDQFDIIVVQQNVHGKWECKTCGKLYNKESNLRKHICCKSENIETETSTPANMTVPNNDEPSVILQNTSNMAIKPPTRVTRSATRNSKTPISDATNCEIKEEILSDNDADIEDGTPFEIIFTNELNSICNIKIENKTTDDANIKNDLNSNNDGLVSAYDSIDNYDKNYNPLINTQQINNSNSSNDFNVEDSYNSDEDDDDDEYNENVDDMIFEKKKKVKNTKHKDELLAEIQHSNLREPVLQSTTSNHDFNEPAITVNKIIQSESINKNLSTKIKIACDLCTKTFVDFGAFTRHKEWHTNIKANTKCSVCNAQFTRKSLLKRHMYSHSNETPFECTICKKSFKSPYRLKKHTKTHDEKRRTCTICNIKFDNSFQLTAHNRRKHNPELVNHSSYVCDICSALFVTFGNMKRHMKRHIEQRQYECKHCKQTFNSYKEKEKHLISHRKNKGKNNNLCPECGKGFRGDWNFIVHMRRHNGIKPFPCKFCEKAFPRSADLHAHERHHTNFRPHKCTICDKAFTRPYYLTTHMRTHTGERPYKCTYCPNAYTQSQDLKTHIRRHTGERFKCNICDAMFIQNHLLSQHKRNEHGMSIPVVHGRLKKCLPPNDKQRSIGTADGSSTLIQSTVPFHLDGLL